MPDLSQLLQDPELLQAFQVCTRRMNNAFLQLGVTFMALGPKRLVLQVSTLGNINFTSSGLSMAALDLCIG